VFNVVQGDGAGVGQALAAHPDIDMMSFTGSTRAGIQVAKVAADSVKRVVQELGGKGPNLVLEGCDLKEVLPSTVAGLLINTGQSCIAQARILVPESQLDEAVDVISSLFSQTRVMAELCM
jgi:aldehyde dehydrogenase (NAD+)